MPSTDSGLDHHQRPRMPGFSRCSNSTRNGMRTTALILDFVVPMICHLWRMPSILLAAAAMAPPSTERQSLRRTMKLTDVTSRSAIHAAPGRSGTCGQGQATRPRSSQTLGSAPSAGNKRRLTMSRPDATATRHALRALHRSRNAPMDPRRTRKSRPAVGAVIPGGRIQRTRGLPQREETKETKL